MFRSFVFYFQVKLV